jgi:hypothetical protein
MSWWDIGDGEVMGDGPADVLTRALASVSQARTSQGEQLPNLQDLLSGYAAALAWWEHGSEAAGPPIALHAVTERDGSERQVRSGDAAPGDLTSALISAVREIDAKYRDRWERPPGLRELTETLTFILAYQPEDVLSDLGGASVQSIAAEESR